MAIKIGTLVIDLHANTSALSVDMNRAQHLAFNSAKAIERSFMLMGTALIGGLGMAAGATMALVATQIEAADAMNKASQSAGVSVESLSALKYAANLADVEFGELTKGLSKLAKAIYAAGKEKDLKGPLHDLGISALGATGQLRPMEEILGDVAEKFKSMSDTDPARIALAMELFGKAGYRLLPFLKLGRAGIAELTDEAKRLGIVISTETAQRAEEFQDNLKRLETAVSGVGMVLAAEVLPYLVEYSKQVVDATTKTDSLKTVASDFADVLRYTATAAVVAYAALRTALVVEQQWLLTIKELIGGALQKPQYWALPGGFAISAYMSGGIERALKEMKAGGTELIDTGQWIKKTLETIWGDVDAATAPKKGAKPQLELPEVNKNIEKIKALIEALEKEAATLGMSADAKKLYDLATLKAKDSVIEHAKALIQYINTQTIVQETEKRHYETREGIKKQLTDEWNALIYTNEQLQIRKAVLAGATAEELAFIDAMQFEVNWLKVLDEETEKNKKATEAWGKQLDQMAASILKSIETPMQRLQEAQSNIIAAWATGRITLSQMLEAAVAADAEVVKKSVEEFKRTDTSMKQFQQDARDMAHAIGTAFEDAILRGKGLRDVFAGLLEDIGRILMRAAITRPLEEALMGKEGRAGTGKVGGVLGWLGSTVLGGWLGGKFAGGISAPSGGPPPLPPYTGEHFAGGGPVFPGASYLVGERGPELFAPSVPGRIIASSDRAAGAVNVYVDARGADAGAEYAAMRGVTRALEQRAVHRAVVTMKEGQARRP